MLGSLSKTALIATLVFAGALIGVHSQPAQAASIRQSCAQGGSCLIGDRGPGGGIVFIIPSTMGNTTGLTFESAPRGWAGTTKDPKFIWCANPDLTIPETMATGIGSGLSNTVAVADACLVSAAGAARGYNGGGLTDWFLPSMEELNLMSEQREQVEGLAAYAYWSSTQQTPSFAWYQLMTRGYQLNWLKSNAFYVRPVREFLSPTPASP